MRAAVTLCVLAIVAGCGGSSSDEPVEHVDGAPIGGARAPIAAFTPPSPQGCVAARDYDACFAITDATPLEVRVLHPGAPRPDAVAFVRFRRVAGPPDPLDLDRMKFTVRGGSELRLYFQVRPGAYLIEVGVDADGDGDPEGAADPFGWSSTSPDLPVSDEAAAAVVEVETTPVATAFTLAARQ
jgi:hypothetical protein